MKTLTAQCFISGGRMHTPSPTNFSSVYLSLDDFFQVSSHIGLKTPGTSSQPDLQVFTFNRGDVLEVTVLAGRTSTQQWEECRFYFQTNESIDPNSLFKVEERGGTKEKFNSVVVLKPNENTTSALIGNNHPHFGSKPLWQTMGQTRDCRSSKMEMLFYAYYMASMSQHADLRNVATMTRWYFGRFFDQAFPSYKDFTNILTNVHDDNPLDRFYYHNTPKLIQRGLDMMNDTDFPVQLCMLSNTNEKLHKSTENRVDEMDKMFDLSIQHTQLNDSLFILGVFPFAAQTIFIFRGGRLKRIPRSEFKTFIASTCRSFTEGKVLSMKNFWNGQCEYVVGIDEDDDECEILSPMELEEACEEDS